MSTKNKNQVSTKDQKNGGETAKKVIAVATAIITAVGPIIVDALSKKKEEK